MQRILFSQAYVHPEGLHPFSFTRPVHRLRLGVFTIQEQWEMELGWPTFLQATHTPLDDERVVVIDESLPEGDWYLIHSNVLPDAVLVAAIQSLQPGELLMVNGIGPVAHRFDRTWLQHGVSVKVGAVKEIHHPEIALLEHSYQLFYWNAAQLIKWIPIYQSRLTLQNCPAHARVTGEDRLFVAESATIEHAFFNTTNGPILIGPNAQIMDGACIRGPVAILEGAVVKANAQIYGGTTVGRFAVVGGEIKNSNIGDYSNKAHEGYLGDSVIGEWCNLGAGTTASNLKNTATPLQFFHAKIGVFEPIPGGKAGLIMGDYSKSAIHTAFNSGTTVGVCAHVFGGNGLCPKHIPNFSWGAEGIERYDIEKALNDLAKWKAFKKETLSTYDEQVLRWVYRSNEPE